MAWSILDSPRRASSPEAKAPSPFAALTRHINALESWRILENGDGEAFETHLSHMLAQEAHTRFGHAPRMLAQIEQEHWQRHGRTRSYLPTSAPLMPSVFSAFSDMAQDLGRSAFIITQSQGWQASFEKHARPGSSVAPTNRVSTLAASLFNRQHCVELRPFLCGSLLLELWKLLAEQRFRSFDHGNLGSDQSLASAPLGALLAYLLSDARIVQSVARVAGASAGSIERFRGRVYRMHPHTDGHDFWHTDVHRQQRRMIGMSLGLAPPPSRGGELQLRSKGTFFTTKKYASPGLGQALLFRLSENIEHRVRAVGGTQDRIVVAGWYCATQDCDYLRWIKAPFAGYAPKRKTTC